MTDENNQNSEFKSKEDHAKEYGYRFYPSRIDPIGKVEESLNNKLNEGRGFRKTLSCINNVYQCLEKNLMVQQLISGLKKHGCDFVPERHISCENCANKVNGGYDPINNQIVVCKNNSSSRDVCCSVMIHELIHMFDFCRAKVDFTDLDHLACTEIRAASIMHCRFLSAWSEGFASLFNFKQKHKDCVKQKAEMSIMMARKVSLAEATAAVEKVFTKCYNDTEPFGRIPRKGSTDPEKMRVEGFMYGYCK